MMLFGDKDNALADTRMKQIVNAINMQDEKALKEVFSAKALDESSNIDSEIDHLLSFIHGEVISWNRDGSPIVFDRFEASGKTKQLVTWYTLETTEQCYLLLLIDYPVDSIVLKNTGLYSLRILKAEDEHKLIGTWEDWTIPGVYILY